MTAKTLFEQAVERRRAGDLPAALALLREAETHVRRQSDMDLLAQIHGELGWVLTHTGDTDAAVDAYTAAVSAADAAGNDRSHALWLVSLVGALGAAGRFDEAKRRIPAMRRAAAATGAPRLIVDAVLQHASILAMEQRYAEAVELFDASGESARGPLLRFNKALTLAKWGSALHQEGQLIQAREKLEAAAILLDIDDPEEAGFALSTYLQLVEIAERGNDPVARRRASRALAVVARQAGHESLAEAAAADVADQDDGVHVDTGDFTARIAAHERDAADAVAAGDRTSEARARTNLAIARLAADDEQAWRDVEVALTAASLSDDRQCEFLLSTAFAYPAIARGERQRAIRFAERAVELARQGTPMQRALAALVRGSVRLHAAGDMAEAQADYRDAVTAFQEVSNVREALPGFAFQHLVLMASTPDATLQEAAARIMGVTLGEASAPETAPTVEELRREHDGGLDVALTAWTGSGTPAGPGEDERLAAMLRMAEGSRWPEAVRRLGSGRSVTPVGHPSAGGPAGLLRLSEHVAGGTVDQDIATAAAQALAVPTDTLACTCLFGISCRPLAPPNVALLQLALATTGDDVLAARLCCLLQTYAVLYGEQERAHELIETGIERLAEGGDESLLVYLLNESSVVLSRLGRASGALARAEETIARADQLGDTEFGDMGRRNRVVALGALGQLAEAEAQLLALDAAQVARGDLAGARMTRLDLARLRAHRGVVEPVVDHDDDDVDGIFTNAMVVALGGDPPAALAEFRRGFELLERTGERHDQEADRRRDFANVLWDAGHREEAVAQMERAAQVFQTVGRVADACEAYTRLTMSLLTEPDVARAHARRAVAAGERIGPGTALAGALAALGSAELSALRPRDALEPLSRAVAMDRSPDILGTFVQALTACDRAAEAVKLLEAELARPESREPRVLAGLLAALGRAARELGHREYALSALAAAYDVARHLPADALTASVADAYADELSFAGYRARAATVLEEARTGIRDGGYADLEEHLMASLGSILRQLGDYQGAERILTEVCERRRPRGRDQVLAASLYALGTVLLSRGDHRAGLDRLREAQSVAEAAGDLQTQASALDTIGFAHCELGLPERAVEYHRRAAALHASLGRHDHEVRDRCGLVHALVLLGDAPTARAELDAALELHARAPSGLAVDHVAAQVHALEGDWQAADALFRSALKGATSAYPVDTPAEARTRANLHDRVLREAMRAAVAAGDARAALGYAEARRARYQHAVIDRRRRRPPDVGEQAWREYEDAADEVAAVRTRRRSAGFASSALDASYHQALERLEVAGTAVFGDGRTAPAPAERLPEFDELVEFVLPGSAVVCLGTGPEGLTVIRAGRATDGMPWADCGTHPGFTAAELEPLLFGPGGWVAAWNDADEEPPYEELDALVARVCDTLRKRVWPAVVTGLPAACQTVLLMPVGGLAALPVHAAALPASGEPSVAVQYVPSLRVLVADSPDLAREPGVLGQVVDPHGDLPFTRCEAAAVAQHHAGPRRALRGPDATTGQVIELLRVADIVQFAGHAAFDVDDPLRSGFTCTTAAGGEDPLTISALLRETGAIRGRMVMLSACESGRVNADDPLDEQIGLAGVLVSVGARNVLAAQWPVDDLVAALVGTEFFARWDHGRVPAAVALGRTQTWLRDEVTVAHVRARLDEWAALAPGDEEIEERREEWAQPMDPQRRPFDAPFHWAPFHIVGAL
jgi:tetratricopeptide (TPR) repeat protein